MSNKVLARALVKLAAEEDRQAAINTVNSCQICSDDWVPMTDEEYVEIKKFITRHTSSELAE